MLDFRQADILDRRWKLRLRWVLDYISSLHCIKIYEHKLQQRLAVLPTLTQTSSVSECWRGIEILRNKIINELAPWIATGPQSLTEVAEAMRQRYLELFPDPNSPEGAAEIARLKEFWRGTANGST